MSKLYGQNDSSSASPNNGILYNRLFSTDYFNGKKFFSASLFLSNSDFFLFNKNQNTSIDPHCSDQSPSSSLSAEQPPQSLEDNDRQLLEEHYLIDELSSSSTSDVDDSVANKNNRLMNQRKKTNNKQPSILNAQKFQLEYYGLFFIVLIILIPLNIPCK